MDVTYKVGNVEHQNEYYLINEIYPKWRTLIQDFRVSTNDNESYFTEKVANYRKDIERTFGVLQAWF